MDYGEHKNEKLEEMKCLFVGDVAKERMIKDYTKDYRRGM